MSHVRAEVLRVSRSRTGWREGGGGTGTGTGTGTSSAVSPSGQLQYINPLKSAFEGASANGRDDKPQLQWLDAGSGTSLSERSFRPPRHTGTKVSTIANMFQSLAPTQPSSSTVRPSMVAKLDSPQNGGQHPAVVHSPDVHQIQNWIPTPLESGQPTPPTPNSGSGVSVHLNRTESHLARFNSARAMFERLEEKIIQKAGGSVSPRRTAFSPTTSSSSSAAAATTMYSRSPSPPTGGGGQTQSVGCSPKRGSSPLLSPRDKSRSEDNIVDGGSSTYCSSSHVMNGRRHDHLDLDLTCSGAGEAIVSPGPLSPHLARYLAENLLVAKGDAAAAAGSPKTVASKPSPLSPKPTDLVFASTATRRIGQKRDGDAGRTQSSKRTSHSPVSTVEPVATHIPDRKVVIVDNKRPVLIGVVEKKTAAAAMLRPPHGAGASSVCNGRRTVEETSTETTTTVAAAVPPSWAASLGCHNLVEPRVPPTVDDDDDDDDGVVEATNQRLLRDVQGAFNRSSTTSASDSGSRILVLSSPGPVEDDNRSLPVPVLNGSWSSTDQSKDSEQTTTTTVPLATSNSLTSHTEIAAHPTPTFERDFVAMLEASTPLGSMASSSSLDAGGFATQGTSPLSPRADCDSESRKVSIMPISVNGDINDGRKPSSHHPPPPTRPEVTTDFPAVMTLDDVDRLLGSTPDDTSNDVTKDQSRHSWFGAQERSPSFQDLFESSALVQPGGDEETAAETAPEDGSSFPNNHKRSEYVEEDGVHVFEDGHFWLEIPAIAASDDDDDREVIHGYNSVIIVPKRRDRVKFSTDPIRVYSTFSVTEYDRRNDDVDPVSASAEYELEKRVEKMDVFTVELMKGREGLGLSIIGMGVGADAGLEKLGIFVKTITEGGAAFKDGRIDVNDQIIEVDGKSLVGVTQAYAASVLRNTAGLVRFSIGRETDGENSEVAQLISQSLQADREREYRRRNYEQELSQQRQNADGMGGARADGEHPGLTLPIPSLSVQPPVTPVGSKIVMQEDSTPEEGEDEPTCEVFDLEESSESPSPDTSDVQIKLNEVSVLERLQAEREDYETRIRILSAHLVEAERIVEATKEEVLKYRNTLEDSQGQYIVLEKKYYKAKKLIKECQQREQDLLQREDYHIQQLQEKDQEYNALVKSLKDRIIQLEQELMETQRAAGLPVKLPYDNTSIRQLQLTPQLLRRPPQTVEQRKRCSSLLDTDISDSEFADNGSSRFDISPDSDDTENKTSTVERKPPVKDEDLFEKAVPQHELLDSTAAKTKAELASKLGSLANRQPPSLKKTSSSGSSGDGLPYDARDSDSNSTSLGSSREDLESIDPDIVDAIPSAQLQTNLCSAPAAAAIISKSPPPPPPQSHSCEESVPKPSRAVEEVNCVEPSDPSAALPTGRGSPVRIDGKFAEEIRIILERKRVQAKRNVASEDPSFSPEKCVHSVGHMQPPQTDVPRDMTPSPMSTVSSHSSHSSDGAAASKRDSTGNERTDYPDDVRTQIVVSPDLIRGPAATSGATPSSHGFAGGGTRTASVDASNSSGHAVDRRPHQWHSCSVSDWSSGQVGQWLLALSMEQYISMFMDNDVGGQELLAMDGVKLKSLGVTNGTDRSLLKRRLKELKALVEKERKAVEKELKTKEKNQKKADRAAEKAVKRK